VKIGGHRTSNNWDCIEVDVGDVFLAQREDGQEMFMVLSINVGYMHQPDIIECLNLTQNVKRRYTFNHWYNPKMVCKLNGEK